MARKTASGDEAAAVAAALARFEAEVGGAPAEVEAAASPWQRAALVEGVVAKQAVQDPQGGARWLS
ncbi:MAG TPA: hypothetical protein VHI77_07770 [Solirubrobacterales bacterium]|jgi:hypothetical protein|nr:hypothetical protein [Solirubrobacterales bacterium]